MKEAASLFFSIMFFFSCLSPIIAKESPKIKNGVLDLRNWDFEKDGDFLALGDWAFFWNQFLNSESIKQSYKNGINSLNNGAFWAVKDHPEKKGEKLPSFGHATFALKIIPPLKQENLAISFSSNASIAFFSDKNSTRLLFKKGKVAKSRELEVPNRSRGFAEIDNYSDDGFYIYVHSSNFQHASGGDVSALKIGKPEQLRRSIRNETVRSAVISSFLILMAIYHLILFFNNREDKPSWYFSLFCFGMFLYQFFVNASLSTFLAKSYFHLEMKIVYFAIYFTACAGVLYFGKLFPSNWFKYITAFSVIWATIGIIFTLLTPVHVYTLALAVVIHVATLFITFSFFFLIGQQLRRRYDARIIFIALFFFLFSMIYTILQTSGIMPHGLNLAGFGVLFLILSNAFVISKRNAKAYFTSKNLSNNLAKEVDRQTREAVSAKDQALSAKFEAEKLKEDALIQNEKLKELDKQKTHFFQNISHELRTPLTLILAPLEEARKSSPEDSNIIVADKNAKRLYRLVNQLLDFQKISAGKKELILKPLDLLNFVNTCADYFRSACSGKDISFKVSTEKLDPNKKDYFINAEIDALEKITLNFLSNALKYTPDGGMVTLGLEIPDENKIRIFVKDTGPGISKEASDKLFKVFSQLDDSTTREHEGTGLGLALTKELAEKMEGSVGVISKLGEGSKFFADFPLIITKDILDLLIIEDEVEVKEALLAALEGSKLINSLKTASSFKEASEIINESKIKCIISDAGLPDGDGLDLFSELSDDKTKRILITGKANEEMFEKSINKAKVDKFFYKPWDERSLLETVENFLSEFLNEDEEVSQKADEISIKDWHLGGEKDDLHSVSDNTDEIESASGLKILVVDDLKDMRELIARSLRKKGYFVKTVKNGDEGLKTAFIIKPSLIITDWMMPVKSGPDMIREIRESKEISSTPVVLLTAKSDEESRIAGKEIGADAFLGKPFNEVELISTVRNLIQLKSSEQRVLELNKHITENILKRYLPADLVEKAIAGEIIFDSEPQSREITVLFSDLVGFTELSSSLEAKETSIILNEYLNCMIASIEKHQGTIDKFMGDGIMVFWGAPKELTSKEQVYLASKCALEMQRELTQLNQKWKIKDHHKTLNMRIGINIGPAVVGNFGNEKRSDYSAIGHDVNLASRIEGVCKPGTVFISPKVKDLIGEEKVASAGNYKLKGIEAETELFSLNPKMFTKGKE